MNDGGPAFPSKLRFGSQGTVQNSVAEICGGMELRDYFAAAALQGYMSIQDERTYGGRGEEFKELSVEEWQETLFLTDAKLCYRYADAMLKARGER